MAEKKDQTFTEKEMYEILLKDFEEFKDDGKEDYVDDLLTKIRKEVLDKE